jgi:predicted house-cleaning noncanonical NTP pyrophosphatase (MazG superfamily)
MSGTRIAFSLNKLVRDKLPMMMGEIGQEPTVITLSGEELLLALIEKVREELSELDPKDPAY